MRKNLKGMHGLSEVAGQNSYSVLGLRQIGVDAQTVIWNKHAFVYPYDLCLHIDKAKKYLLPWYMLKLLCFFIYALFRYNTFHFHFGRSICFNHELWLYDLLKKKYVYEFHGSDLRDYEEFYKKSDMPFNPEYTTSNRLRKRNARICARASQIILHDDELIPYLPPEHAPVQVLPLRVDVSAFSPVYPRPDAEKIRIVHAPSKRASKGTDHVIAAVERLKKRYPNIELVLVEGMPQSKAKAVYATADIVVDQLYAGTYGVFAVEAMATGKPVITYISDEMKALLPEDLPIVSASIHTIDRELERLIVDGALRHSLGLRGREYAETYHDYKNVAKVLQDIYLGESGARNGA